MGKKSSIMKGFNSLLKSTGETEPPPQKLKLDGMDAIKKDVKRFDAQTPKSPNAEKYKRANVAKYKELKKCTLYLPSELVDSLAIMKVKTKKDLSELTAEALREYLKINKFLNV